MPIVFGRRYLLAFLVFSLAFAITSPNSASADPCSIQLGFPIIPAVYANTIVTVVVPLSAVCSTSFGNQLYVNANVFDLNSDTAAGSANTLLTSVNGGYTFTGQLGFNLPPSTQGHWVQVSVSIFGSQGGKPLTTNGEAFQINAETVQVITTTVFPQTSIQSAPSAPSAPETYPEPPSIFAYVAIAALVAVVIIVTVGLIVFSRKPVNYPPVPRGY